MKTSKPALVGKDFVSYGHYLLKVAHPDGSRVEAVTGNMDLVERLNSEDKKEREEAEREAIDFVLSAAVTIC